MEGLVTISMIFQKIDKNYLKGIVAVLNPTKKIEILEIQRDLVDSKSKYPIFYTEFELNEGSEKIQNYEILKKLITISLLSTQKFLDILLLLEIFHSL